MLCSKFLYVNIHVITPHAQFGHFVSLIYLYVSLINLLQISGNLHGAETRESGAVSYRKDPELNWTAMAEGVEKKVRAAHRVSVMRIIARSATLQGWIGVCKTEAEAGSPRL